MLQECPEPAAEGAAGNLALVTSPGNLAVDPPGSTPRASSVG